MKWFLMIGLFALISQANAVTIAFDSTGGTPEQWGIHQWQGQGWLIGSESAQLQQGFQFVSESTGTLSDIWLRGLFDSAAGYDYTVKNTVIEIHSTFGNVLETFTVDTVGGTNHYQLESNLQLNVGNSYWIVLSGEDIDSYFAWTNTENMVSNYLPHAYRYASGVHYDGEWQFDERVAGGFAVGVSAVPVPAAVWLFGSGLLGLFGIARRKKTG